MDRYRYLKKIKQYFNIIVLINRSGDCEKFETVTFSSVTVNKLFGKNVPFIVTVLLTVFKSDRKATVN
jgi:hypothetical protein